MPDANDYDDEAWQTRFDGYRRGTLDDLVDQGLAVYDYGRAVWVVQGANGPFEVRDVDASAQRLPAGTDDSGPPLEAAIDGAIVRFDAGRGPAGPLDHIIFQALHEADIQGRDGTTTQWRRELLRQLEETGPHEWYEITYAGRPGGLTRRPIRVFDEEDALRAARRMSAVGERVDVTLVASDSSRSPVGSFLGRRPLPGAATRRPDPRPGPRPRTATSIPAAAQAARPPVLLPPDDTRASRRQFPDGISPLPVTATWGGPMRPTRLLHADGVPVDIRPMADSPLEPAVAVGVVPATGDLAPGRLQVIQRPDGKLLAVHPAQVWPRGVNPIAWLPFRQQRRCWEFDGAEAMGLDSKVLQATYVDQGDRIRTAAGELREVTACTWLNDKRMKIATTGPDGNPSVEEYDCLSDMLEVMIPARHPAEDCPAAAQLFAIPPPEHGLRDQQRAATAAADWPGGQDAGTEAELAGLAATLGWVRRDGSPAGSPWAAAPLPGHESGPASITMAQALSRGSAPPGLLAAVTAPGQAGWRVSVGMTGRLLQAQDPAAAAIGGLRQHPIWLRLRALTSNSRRLAADASAGRLQFSDPGWALRSWRAVWARVCELTCDLAARMMTDWLLGPGRHHEGSRAWQAARNLHHAAAEGVARAHGWLPRHVRLPIGSYEPPGGRRVTAAAAPVKALNAARLYDQSAGTLSQLDFPAALEQVTARAPAGRRDQLRAARPAASQRQQARALPLPPRLS